MYLSSHDAAELIGVTSQTIRRYVDRDLLPAQKVGLRPLVKIKAADLRTFAVENGYIFDETAYRELVPAVGRFGGHTVAELAADRELWAELVDVHNAAPYDDYTQDKRERLIFALYPSDFDEYGEPYDD